MNDEKSMVTTEGAPWEEQLESSFETELLVPKNPGYSSLQGTDRASKIIAYNLWTKPNKRLKECCGEVLDITDVMCETVKMKNRDGVTQNTPRLVLIDTEMQGYVCLSLGVYNQLTKLIQVFGPPTWREPLKLKPYIEKKNGWEMLNFELIP